MPGILVQSPGLFTTVQDLGRPGYASLGVTPSGACDPIALRLGNRLVGNPENAAALEMTLLGGRFVFDEEGVIALTGASCEAALDGAPVPMWTAYLVRGGQTLTVGTTLTGARCYLAVRGGIAVTSVLGSASTHVLTRLGGVDGRALRKGDVLSVGEAPAMRFELRTIAPAFLDRLRPRKILRTTVAPQTDLFPVNVRKAFYANPYRVTEQSDRMGLRLEGKSLEGLNAGQMISEGVALGAVQVPPNGQPIILFVDRGTLGGYPKIANVISADLPSIGQLRPNDVIRFELVSAETAQTLIREQEHWLRSAQ
jgi:antagonist of KipI